jgi:hypothetical protein
MDENAVMDDIFAQLSGLGVQVIDVREAFNASVADGNQLYYRTDHHWTTDGGAFLAYGAFCKTVGRETITPPASLKRSADGFYGTNYSKALNINAVPDTLVYYDLPNPVSVERRGEDGVIYMEEETLMAYGQLETRDKYAAFLHGNNGYTYISGDGSGEVLLIKDSYGNSFAPYLINNYKDIKIADMRGRRNIDDIAGSGDILLLYSFASFIEDTNLMWVG